MIQERNTCVYNSYNISKFPIPRHSDKLLPCNIIGPNKISGISSYFLQQGSRSQINIKRI